MSDLISRADATCEVLVNDGIDNIVDRINALPSAEAEWIPCSERLPSGDEQVIISVCDDRGDTPYWYTATGWRCQECWISDNDYVCGTVTAWMPLPMPYREDGE